MLNNERDAHLAAVAAYDDAEAGAGRSEHGTWTTTLDREHRAVQATWEAWLAVDEQAATTWNEAQYLAAHGAHSPNTTPCPTTPTAA